MKEALYLNNNLALINYTKTYYTSIDELMAGEAFEMFLKSFLQQYKTTNYELYYWITKDIPIEPVVEDIKKVLQVLMVLDIEDIRHPLLQDRARFIQIIEDAYLHWRDMQRYSIVFTANSGGLQNSNFMDADNEFNKMILDFYRKIQQKVQGSKNHVYRQLQAGTNASFLLRNYKWDVPYIYSDLIDIPFINSIMLRTPLIIHPKCNKRVGSFVQADYNPISDFVKGDQEWFCFPCKVGSLLTFVYFQRDFTSSAVALSNLFEIATDEECINKKPDCMVLFGNKDNKNETTFFHDEKNDIWVGKVSYNEVIEYFGYIKKMSLTLHNLKMQSKGWLPLHGAMINLHLKDGTTKGIAFIGDSGAGKSETIEALSHVTKQEVMYSEIIFDDMGSMHIEDGVIVGQGTEIGAFVRLDDLDKGSAYRDMDRSIFFNPESANARVVIPAAPYSTIVTSHKIDMFIYANNYTDKRGLRRVDNIDEAKDIFVTGKRFALGTTQEKGISTTFFANPFGPMQKQEQCLPIIDEMFAKLFDQGIFVGEIFTCLGLENKGDDGLKIAAIELFEEIKNL